MPSRRKLACQVWDCVQRDVPQVVEREEHEGLGADRRLIASWLPCGHFVAPPLPVRPLPPPMQYGVLS